MKKKVVFKTKSFPTGSETFVVNNVVEAIKNGFEVTIITDKKNNPSQSTQKQLLKDYKISEKIKEYTEPKRKFKRYLKALKLVFNPVLFYYYIRYSKFKKKKSLSNLFRLAFYYPYRRITFHVHFSTALEPLLELKKIGFLKSKIIVTFHGYDAHGLPSNANIKEIKTDFVKYISHITVNSHFLKMKLLNKHFEHPNISIVPIGVDFSFFKREKNTYLDDKRVELLSIGRLVAFKGHEFGIKAVKILLDKGYDIKYKIIGEGPEFFNLNSLIKKLSLENQVKLLGKKNQQEIKDFLESSNLFLMTSSSDQTGRREDFGVVSLEAQAMELPVVGFQSGGFPETLVDGKTGFLVEDKDIAAMAAAVEKLINDRQLLQQMGKQARAHVVENFSFKKTTKKYLELY